MISCLLVLLSFGLMFLSDWLKLTGHRKQGKYLLLLGMMVLVAAGINASVSGSRFQIAPLPRILFLLVAAAAALLEYFALFSSLPAVSTYLGENERQPLVDGGMYSLCRHPGALWFPLFSLSLALGLGNWEMLLSAGLASALNLLYVFFQDRLVFPKTIADYAQYQKNTPFLIPTGQSILRAIGKESKKQVKQ
jgi:protein-S-isoprenylcysteine O-methyltransferase Ste14